MCNNNVKAIMKKIYSFLFAATALFAAVSCQKEVAPEVEAPKGEKITFTASTEVETKTALHENGKSTIWEDGDQISVFDANKEGNNRCFNIDALSDDAKTATFSYEGEFVKDQSGMADPTVVALYPYQENAYCDFFYYDRNYITGINFPAEQTAVAGSFDSKAAFALGLGTMNKKELGFQNLYSLLKFTVRDAGVKKVTVKVNEGAYIAGDAKIQMDLNTEKIGGSEPVFEAPVLSIVENGTNTVKLSCKNGFSTEATYYIAVVPTSYESISVAYDGVVVKEIEKANTLQANKIYNLGSYPEEFVPQEGYVYLKPNSNWKTANARFAAYFFSQKWADMTLVDGQVNVYQCAIPEGEEGGMLFCRMNPNNTENRWNVDNEENAPVWNQTIDLSLTDGCVYTMNEGSWEKGTWSGNPAVEKPVLPEVTPGESSEWAIIGDFDKSGTWVEKQMVTTSESGVFVIEGLQVPNDYFSVLIKKFGDSAWSVKYGGGIVYFNPGNHMKVNSGGTDISITKAGTYDFYFDLNNTKLYVVAAGVDYTTAPEQTVEGEEPKQEEPEVTAKVVYLKPNSNWTQSNARFAAYFWGGAPGEKWVSMTAVGDGTYEVHLPDGYDYGCNIIFCRMKPSTTANNWNNKWNQTSDLTTPTGGKNLYTVKENTWDKGGGTWSVKQ